MMILVLSWPSPTAPAAPAARQQVVLLDPRSPTSRPGAGLEGAGRPGAPGQSLSGWTWSTTPRGRRALAPARPGRTGAGCPVDALAAPGRGRVSVLTASRWTTSPCRGPDDAPTASTSSRADRSPVVTRRGGRGPSRSTAGERPLRLDVPRHPRARGLPRPRTAAGAAEGPYPASTPNPARAGGGQDPGAGGGRSRTAAPVRRGPARPRSGRGCPLGATLRPDVGCTRRRPRRELVPARSTPATAAHPAAP